MHRRMDCMSDKKLTTTRLCSKCWYQVHHATRALVTGHWSQHVNTLFSQPCSRKPLVIRSLLPFHTCQFSITVSLQVKNILPTPWTFLYLPDLDSSLFCRPISSLFIVSIRATNWLSSAFQGHSHPHGSLS